MDLSAHGRPYGGILLQVLQAGQVIIILTDFTVAGKTPFRLRMKRGRRQRQTNAQVKALSHADEELAAHQCPFLCERRDDEDRDINGPSDLSRP